MTASERRTRLGIALAALCGVSAPAAAQDRSADNAVTQADDAFGFRVGREAIGIYSANNTRGFSPAQAGNIRLEGLFFDELADLGSPLVGNTAIKVGLAAQGYPFAAPSGIVDMALRRPATRAGASVVVNTDTYGTGGIEIDGSQPLARGLTLGWGLTGGGRQYADGTSNAYHGQSLLLDWRPSDRIEIIPFWSLDHIYDDQSGTFYLPAGNFVPPVPPAHRFDGPSWTGNRFVGANAGVIASVSPAKDWTIRAGLFRSVIDQSIGFTNFLADELPDGTGERITYVDPRAIGRSLSGEVRVSRRFADGSRSHLVQLSFRGRDTDRQFGGTDAVDLGPGRVGVAIEPPRPAFAFGPLSSDHVRQSTLGLSYEGRWRGLGSIGVSIGRASYRDDVRLAGVEPTSVADHPIIGNAGIAVTITGRLVAFAGYARGLEQSGSAPATAANRNQPLGAILTSQRDAGLRWAATGDIRVVVGIFDLRRPYFNFDAANFYRPVGGIRSRGVELSVNGHLTPTLAVVAGGYLLDPVVEAGAAQAGTIGRRPYGLRTYYGAANVNWQTPARGVTLDLSISRRSSVPATIDNAVYLPPHLEIAPGARYGFRVAGHSATARVQVTNLTDDRYFGLAGPGLYVAQARRYANGYLAIDI